MKYWIGVTDNSWFRFLAEREPDEVNFWRPGGKAAFRAIQPGSPFLFKLHSPENFIAGGGFFVRHTVLPLSLAWEAFGDKNGAGTFDAFRTSITRRRKQSGDLDPSIGCTILAEPFFFERTDWIPAPSNWRPSIQQGKTYDTEEPVGRAIMEQVLERLPRYQHDRDPAKLPMPTPEPPGLYGSEYLTRARLGQGAFRVLVTDAYERRCAITGERTLPVLQAAHIKPFAESGPNRVDNGLLLRSDLHILFDRGFLTIDKDHRVEVSRRIREEYENGRDYYALRGKQLQVVPANYAERPSPDFVAWHNEEIFKG
ncbi:MAG: HNH endonuclease [Candidatus Krumholzibacteriia bacterium]